MKVTIENNELVIRAPLADAVLSKTGKSYIVAGTAGFLRTDVLIKGRPVSVSLNAIIPVDKPAQGAPARSTTSLASLE